ncbi:MAG: hypothetical protein H0X67_00965 [Acidobacteria bacterium]|nr:hypothetical protein [Acidobacteriota bacterium]
MPMRALTSLPDTDVRERLDALVAALNSLDRQVATLTATVAALMALRAPGPRDRADKALVGALAVSTRGLSFTAAAVWRHRAVDEALADALEQADVDSPRQLGRLLRRVEGRTVDGVRIARVGADREGLIWRASLQE